jgi:hypothetical protein
MKIIGLYSPCPQSGKSTVAEMLQEEGFPRSISFADPLRGMLRELLLDLGIEYDRVIDYLYVSKEAVIPEVGRSARLLLRTLGTEWGREMVSSDLWVAAWKSAVTAENVLNVVTDDVRMPNEYHAVIMQPGGQVWRVTRPGLDGDTSHSTDGALNNMQFDREIVNDGSLEDLRLKVLEALQ